MIEQKGIKNKAIHKKEFLGAHPIIEFFIDKLRIREIISSLIKQDERLSIPVEKTLCVLIHNILTSPCPMYELSDWIAPLSENALGLNSGDIPLINDHRMGAALDSFYDGKNKEVFFRLALRAIKIFDLKCSNIHQDTTTITASGRYEDWDAQEKLTYGKNKDYRPDLKQLVLGMSITGDGGVPLVHQVYDGNQSDSTLHIPNYERLMKILSGSDFIYTADSKLASENNLMKISSYGGKFITVMPATWKEDLKFKNLVRKKKVKWKHLLTRKNSRKPDSEVDIYKIAEEDYQTSHGYRLLWIKSSQKQKIDKATRETNIEKCLEDFSELRTGLNKRKLKTKKNINSIAMGILKKRNCFGLVDFEILSEREYGRSYVKKGRPTSEQKSSVTWKELFSISFQVSLEAALEAELTDGIFPLVTNLDEKITSKKILETYKYQPFLEKRHSQLKTWQVITPVLFKKGSRVVSYIHMNVMALMVASLIEREIRKSMKENIIEKIAIYPDGKSCQYPTLYGIVRLFNDIEKYEVEINKEKTYFPARLDKTQQQVLKLLSIPLSLYQ
jgi:transposase